MFHIASCTKTTSVPFAGGWLAQGFSSISPNTPSYLENYKINLAIVPEITTSLYSGFYIKRDSTFSTSINTTALGTTIKNTDEKFIKLLCFNNPPYSSINRNSTLNGWATSGINHLFNDTFTGIVKNINGELSASSAISLSFTITFFPDGIYTIVNHLDENLNQIGNYQPVIEKGILTGIIYKISKVSTNFTQNYDSRVPYFTNNPLSYGVWGIDENFFFPLFLIDRTNTVFLRMRKHTY